MLKRLAQFAAKRSSEDRIPQVAGSLTFTTMLALVPLATVAFALFTAFPIFSSFQMSLQIFLADHLMPAQLNSQIFDYLNQFASKAKSLTTIGMIFLFVTAVMTMMTVESAFNVIWRVRKARPIAQRILVYWAIITLGPILIGVSLSISSYLFTRSMAFTAVQHIPSVIDWALTGAALPLTALAFTMLYVFLPNCRVEWRDAVIGGVAAAIAFELAKRGFGYYVRRIPTYTTVYGAFAAVPLFLLWMYLCWFIALAGAMIASALPAIRIGQFHRPTFEGSDLFDSLELLARLSEARDAGKRGYTVQELSRMLRREMDTTINLLQKLEEIEWIARLDDDGTRPHFLLLANPAQITVKRLFDLFVIDRAELEYQLELASTRVDGQTLLAALENDKLEVTLAALLAARAAARATRAQESEQGASSMPPQAA
ncbi:YihY family inner membrane protein [Burkholderia sp. R-69927]|nr:YihY family inner membrane protein [Burkholderia sp. R-70006]MBK5058759.1 YihY family inner membrane protein [Burkholderia sp. R-70199]MBK5087770.1 YihY family inner membrane protein [Burkholderia sp. R-69927]MBK5123350.1 YihY family inner membrane protein [Burkholderia sp. R-69980]MBK5181335.1 YihY family inner membrane protein [Burkholderia sp. R-69749]MCI0144976.1 YihY family inner membrane protein [Paraburkholderia sediminicola]